MAERSEVEPVAAEIIAEVSREFPRASLEFPRASLELDFEAPRDDHEDAYLWITPGTRDREEINDLWGFVIKLVQDAYQERDGYLVARMRGAGVIIRDGPDQE